MNHGKLREVLGRKYATEVLELLVATGPLNYTEIERQLSPPSDVLSDRLDTLERHDLIERDERSHRNVRYSTTTTGERAWDRVRDLAGLLDID